MEATTNAGVWDTTMNDLIENVLEYVSMRFKSVCVTNTTDFSTGHKHDSNFGYSNGLLPPSLPSTVDRRDWRVEAKNGE